MSEETSYEFVVLYRNNVVLFSTTLATGVVEPPRSISDSFDTYMMTHLSMPMRLRYWLTSAFTMLVCANAALCIAQEPDTPTPPGTDLAKRLTDEQVRNDIEQFRRLVHDRWILSTENSVDFDAALDNVLLQSVGGTTKEELVLELQRVIALGIDGHACMSDFLGIWNGQATRNGVKEQEEGQLPFLIDLCGDQYVAYVHDRSPGDFVNPKRKYRYRLLHNTFPLVKKIDGVAIEKWVECARQFVPKGPEEAVRWRCVQVLSGLRFMRGQLGLENRDSVHVTLASEDFSKSTKIEMQTADLYEFHLKKPRPDWTILHEEKGDIGYVWLHTGAAPGSEVLATGMSKFRNAKGLIIDCRDNVGHGPPDTSLILGAFLLPDDSSQKVVGAIAKNKNLSNNAACVYPGMPGLSNDEEATIHKFHSNFHPALSFPKHRIDWNYVMLKNPRVSEPRWGVFEQPRVRKMFVNMAYRYEYPVVLLTNHRTFSAGEVFVACMQSLPNVTIVGTPTAASAVGPAKHTLSASELGFIWGERLFVRANGQLIDGNGITPDVVVEIDPDYYRDTRDRTLEKAIEVILEKNSRTQRK